MAPIPLLEVAGRAGVEPAFIERLVALEILQPNDEGNHPDGDVQRARIVLMLSEAGLPLEGLAEALRRDVLSIDIMSVETTHDRWAALSDTTFAALSERIDVPVELLMVIREAQGFAPPAPGDRMREDELEVVPLVRLMHEFGSRPGLIERALRVVGESMRRVAETESDWWRDEVLTPIIDTNQGIDALSQVAFELSPPMAVAGDQAMLAIYHGQQTHAWLRNLLEGFENALQGAGLYEPPQRVPAICFLDLTGYTRLTEVRGDNAAADIARDLSTLVQQRSVRHGGTAVKWLGDGVMFHFPEPGDGVLAALEMVETAPGSGLSSAHVGLHAGPVLFQEGDYFGRTVNVAARIADYARPGEVVVSQEVVDASSVDGVGFDEIGPVELKGVSGEVHLLSAHRRG